MRAIRKCGRDTPQLGTERAHGEALPGEARIVLEVADARRFGYLVGARMVGAGLRRSARRMGLLSHLLLCSSAENGF